jgi:NADPH:quinone reductase-like Zn-dependent oxidoreductase
MSYRKLEFSEFGEPQKVLQLKKGDSIPKAGADEIVIKLIASPIHPSVEFFIKGIYGIEKPKLPAVPGNEGVGIIHETGSGVTGLKKGQRVAFSGKGVWSEYVVIKKPFTRVVPMDDERITNMIAGQFFVNPVAAYVMLFDELRVTSNDWVLQSAANSVLGNLVIQLSKVKGFKLINFVRKQKSADELKEKYGDINVIVADNKNDDKVIEQVKELTNGKGANYAIDPVGSPTTELILNCLAELGKVLVFSIMGGNEIKISAHQTLFKMQTIKGFWEDKWYDIADPKRINEIHEDLKELFATKKLEVPVFGVFTFEDYLRALESNEKVKGKVFLSPDPKEFEA